MSHAFIFIGRSGCGKGTQAELLMDSFKKTGVLSSAPILYIETGDRFREFVKGENFSSTLAQKINADGRRQPDFLACAMWTEVLIAQLTGKEHVVLDGTPRSILEAEVLTTALDFYSFEKKIIIHLDVSRAWSEERLRSRGRADDSNMEKISKRLDWFDADVVPALEFFEKSPKFDLVSVSGEHPIEEVHSSIVSAVLPLIS